MRKRAEANDAASIYLLSDLYYHRNRGVQQDISKAIELLIESVYPGCSQAHNRLGHIYYEVRYLKKAKFNNEAAAIAGHEGARYSLGVIENDSRNIEQAVKLGQLQHQLEIMMPCMN